MRLFGRTKDIAVYPQNDDVAQVRSKLAAVDAGMIGPRLVVRFEC